MNDRVIGIIGGMGPLATVDCYRKIIEATEVQRDQDHFRVFIDSNPKIPDRTQAILGNGESPVPALIESARNLERAGVDIAVIPCMTAHFFLEAVQQAVSYPILNVIESVARYIETAYPGMRRVGVLCTTGTRQAGLFDAHLRDFEVIYPTPSTQQQKVMRAIYGEHGIKNGSMTGEAARLLAEAAAELVEDGAEIIVAGCTEIPVALMPDQVACPLIDPIAVAAASLVLLDSVSNR